MARSRKAPATTTTPATVSKADAIRAYYKEHPELGPKDIAAALVKQGVDVTAGSVSGVLRTGMSRKVDVDTIKRAAEFVGQYEGKLADAVKAIDAVGGFIESCGNAEKAKAALEAYETVVAVVK